MLRTNTSTRQMSSIVPPAASTALLMFSHTLRVCASMSPTPAIVPSGRRAVMPEMNTSRPCASTAMGWGKGALGARTRWLAISRLLTASSLQPAFHADLRAAFPELRHELGRQQAFVAAFGAPRTLALANTLGELRHEAVEIGDAEARRVERHEKVRRTVGQLRIAVEGAYVGSD